MSMEDVDYFAGVVVPPATPARDAAVSVPVLGTPELCRYRPAYYPTVGFGHGNKCGGSLGCVRSDASDQIAPKQLDPDSSWEDMDLPA